MAIRPRRSALYMPGSNARALEKAKTLPADVLILDLEDAVAPDAKAAAREQVATATKAKGFGPREVVIRINGLETPWGKDDLVAAVAAAPDAILVPKVSSAADLVGVGKRLVDLHAPPALSVWAMIETPIAILRIAEIASEARDALATLRVLVMGTNDLVRETRARFVPGRAPVLPHLTLAVAAARAFGLDIVDGVYNDIEDAEGFARECAQGRDLGFDGKTLIHPSQIEPCNAAFSPTAAEVEQARKIVAAFDLPENRDKGAIALQGRMVERLHAEIAQRTLLLHEAIAARGETSERRAGA
jgi:citrate lyase subunit beta/citryl-CoA lyase